MRRKCHTCLCWTCMTVCCDQKNCIGKKESCENYSGFRQMSIFGQSIKPQHQKAPRYSWNYYGISKERYKELTVAIQSGRYASLTSQAAYAANKEIARYLIKSVVEGKSYDQIEFDTELGRICVCRTDFYGWRRYFYHLFDLEIRRIEK